MNMDYCKFENTKQDMMQCLFAFEEGRKTSQQECECAEYMFEQILGTMYDLGIIEDWDGDLLHDCCQEMNEDSEEL